MLTTEHARPLEQVFQVINATIGPCRLEGTTFREVALVIPLVHRAAEACIGGSLPRRRLCRNESGRLHGRLAKHAFRTLSTEAMHAWPFIVAGRGLAVRIHRSWVYWDTAQGLPPRIDYLTDLRLPSSPFLVDGWVLQDRARGQKDNLVVSLLRAGEE